MPLIPLQIPPFGCLKSNNNSSHRASRQLGLALTAQSSHMVGSQDVKVHIPPDACAVVE